MTTLILAGETIVAASDDVQTYPWGFESDGVQYPDAAGVTGLAQVASLPSDFRTDRYVWRNGGLVKLPDPTPPPAQSRTTLRAYLKMALSEAGHLAAVDAAVTAQGGAALILWQEAVSFSEADPEIIAISAALGIDRKAIWDRCDQIAEARRLARAE